MAVFYTACSLAGAFSGLLAYAIEKMQGIAGLNGWQWIFIIEGLYPVVCAVFVWFLLPDQPETASFLSQPERDFVIHRLSTETGSGEGKVTNSDRIQWRHIKDAFLEWKVWLAMIIYSAVSIGIYGFTSTVPIAVQQLGYSAANAQLMTIPVRAYPVFLLTKERRSDMSRYMLRPCSACLSLLSGPTTSENAAGSFLQVS
jgi:sugar phosphate permease